VNRSREAGDRAAIPYSVRERTMADRILELEDQRAALIRACSRLEHELDLQRIELTHALRRESLLERIVHAFTGDRRRAEAHEARHGRHG
jgi:hypothetical protein